MIRLSGTSFPASIVFLASRPTGEPEFTAARSMSPVETWGILNFSQICAA